MGVAVVDAAAVVVGYEVDFETDGDYNSAPLALPVPLLLPLPVPSLVRERGPSCLLTV